MSRWLVPFLCSYLLLLLLSQLNHWLAPVGVYLYFGGLYVTFAALHLGFRRGLAATLLIGLLIDATEPVPFGTHLALLGAAHTAIFCVRSRLPREETFFSVIVALVANLAVFAILSLVLFHRGPGGPSAGRFCSDLFFSSLALAAAAPWFFALQREALLLSRVDLAAEQRDQP